MSRRTRVYLAGPYSRPDHASNVHAMIRVGNVLMDHGYAPLIPLMSHFLDIMHPRPYEDWIDIDLSFVPACDVLLRLPGESPDADREVSAAIDHGITVYTDLTALLSREPARR